MPTIYRAELLAFYALIASQAVLLGCIAARRLYRPYPWFTAFRAVSFAQGVLILTAWHHAPLLWAIIGPITALLEIVAVFEAYRVYTRTYAPGQLTHAGDVEWLATAIGASCATLALIVDASVDWSGIARNIALIERWTGTALAVGIAVFLAARWFVPRTERNALDTHFAIMSAYVLAQTLGSLAVTLQHGQIGAHVANLAMTLAEIGCVLAWAQRLAAPVMWSGTLASPAEIADLQRRTRELLGEADRAGRGEEY